MFNFEDKFEIIQKFNILFNSNKPFDFLNKKEIFDDTLITNYSKMKVIKNLNNYDEIDISKIKNTSTNYDISYYKNDRYEYIKARNLLKPILLFNYGFDKKKDNDYKKKLEKFEKEIISLLNYYNGNISKINKEIFKKKLIYAFKYFYEELKIKIELNNSNIDKFIETFNEILKLKYNNYFVDLGTILEIYYEITNNNSNIELLNLKGYKLKNKINNIAYYFKYDEKNNKIFSIIYNINFYSLSLTEKYKLLDNITKIIIDTNKITIDDTVELTGIGRLCMAVRALVGCGEDGGVDELDCDVLGKDFKTDGVCVALTDGVLTGSGLLILFLRCPFSSLTFMTLIGARLLLLASDLVFGSVLAAAETINGLFPGSSIGLVMRLLIESNIAFCFLINLVVGAAFKVAILGL